jgi:hypothetical protein
MERHFVVVEGWAAGASRAVVVSLAVLGLASLAPVPARADAVSSPGKVTAVRSAAGFFVDTTPVKTTVQLVKGKRRNLLIVNGVLSGSSTVAGTFIGLGVTVNGIHLEPNDATDSRIFQRCEVGFCTVSGTWWVDLDAVETAHPGMFVNMPLSVELQSQAFVSLFLQAKVSITATMVKK